MQTSPPHKLFNVESDPRLFTMFLTLVVAGMYAVTLLDTPAMRQPVPLSLFTLLVIIHVVLHWQLENITKSQTHAVVYTITQGMLAFGISWMAGGLGMIFALFLALLGEAVGLFGLTRQGLLAGGYYLVLMIANLVGLSGWAASSQIMLGILPMTFFVVMYVTLYMRQNSAREQAQKLAAELEAANRQLAEYAAQVEDLTITNERQRMARELHDTLSQGLAGIILQLEATEAYLASSRPEKARAIISNAMLQARATLADARNAIDDLRQAAPDDLDPALRLEISRFSAATGLPCAYHAEIPGALPVMIKETVIRIAAEAFSNIAHHARATQASVTVTASGAALEMEIVDNGIGFDPAQTSSGHYGLLGIRERVRLVNGTFTILSETGRGTTLKISLPL